MLQSQSASLFRVSPPRSQNKIAVLLEIMTRPTRQLMHQPAPTKTTATNRDSHQEQNAVSSITVMDKNDILRLQRQIGNAAVVRLLSKHTPTASDTEGKVQRLPDDLTAPMQTMFGETARSVRLHTGNGADSLARKEDKDAISIGNDIYFRNGAYRPGTAAGNAVIAREMTHVAQRHHAGAKAGKSAADEQEASELAGMVHDMGDSPSTVLQPSRDGDITPVQQKVLQRNPPSATAATSPTTATPANALPKIKTSKARLGGIVLSKAVQGVANGIAGPIGLIWRWPLIRKNVREYGGMTTGKNEKQDKNRYGKTGWGRFGAALSATAEVLKELTIWLGFATLISAILAGASYGAAAPVFAVLAAITVSAAGLMLLMKSYLVGHNIIRLIKEGRKDNADPAKRRMIKHQLWIDGLDGIGAIISTITGVLGTVGAVANVSGGSVPFSGSAGGAASGALGYEGAAKPIIGKTINELAYSPAQGGILNSVKEGGKEATKQGAGGFKAGFLKDWNDMKTQKNEAFPDGMFFKNKPKADAAAVLAPALAPQQASSTNDADSSSTSVQDNFSEQSNTWSDSTSQQQDDFSEHSNTWSESESDDSETASASASQVADVENKLKTINSRSQSLESEQQEESSESGKLSTALQDNFGDFGESTSGMNDIQSNMQEANDSKDQIQSASDQAIDNIRSEDTYKETKKKINDGLALAEEQTVEDDKDTDAVDEQKTINKKPADGVVQRGFGSRIKGWFLSKLGGLKRGMRRLNNKLMVGLFKFLGKFGKANNDFAEMGNILNAEMMEAAQDQQMEDQNSAMSGDFSKGAGQALALFEQAKQQK